MEVNPYLKNFPILNSYSIAPVHSFQSVFTLLAVTPMGYRPLATKGSKSDTNYLHTSMHSLSMLCNERFFEGATLSNDEWIMAYSQ